MRSRFGRQDTAPWLAGLAVSLAIFGGLTLAVLAAAIIVIPGTVNAGALLPLAVAVAAFCGGYRAGIREGVRNWLASGAIGLLTCWAAAALLLTAAPRGLTVSELLQGSLLCFLLSAGGTLAGANWYPRNNVRRYDRRQRKAS